MDLENRKKGDSILKNSIYSKVIFLALFVVLVVQTASAQAANIAWTDWTNVNSAADIASGQVVNNSGNIDVNYSGVLDAFVDGDTYYKGYPATYDNSNPTDLIRIWNKGSVNIGFSKPVLDPYFAFVSVGRSNSQVDYKFLNLQSPLQDISHGTNNWGFGSYILTDDTLKGKEYNGIIKLPGVYTDISFDIKNPENWHGFNVGISSTSPPPPVPEPTSMALGAMGLAGILSFKRRKK